MAEMTRPRTKAKRDKQLNFSLTADELTTLQFRAQAVGMHLVDYGRAMLLRAPLVTVDASTDTAATQKTKQLALIQLRRVGNNLNQIARHLHTFCEPAPPDLEPLLGDLRRLINTGDFGDR